MDHAEAREIMELAAVEPGGVERLEAGDMPDSVAVATHLAGCESCRDEWERLVAMSEMLRDAFSPAGVAADRADGELEQAGAGRATIATVYTAPPELRDRTLRYVRELGRPAAPAATPEPEYATTADEPSVVSIAPLGSPARAAGGRRGGASRVFPRRWRTAGQFVGLAASIVLVAALGVFAYTQSQAASDAQGRNKALVELVSEQAAVAATKDAQTVSLLSADGAAKGSVIFSVERDHMVMVASGLPQPAANETLRCWVQTANGRRILGDVTFEGGMGYWSGWPGSGLSDIRSGDRFGVSLVQNDQPAGSAQVLLTGVVGG